MTTVLYRTLHLGDFLTAVPAYRGVVAAVGSKERVVLAAPAALAPLVPLVGGIARHAPTPELGTPARVALPVQLAVNLHGRGPQSHRALAPLQPQRLVGFACPEVDHEGPAWRDDEHDVRRWVRLLRESGIAADPADLHLSPPAIPSPRLGAVVVHPGASSPRRRWPEDRFARLAATLRREGAEVVVTGVAGERALAERVARRAGLPASAVLAGRLDLGGMAALVSTARLVVCGDTGVAHLASAFATPSVVLFADVAPTLWGPPVDGPHTVIHRPVDDGRTSGGLLSIMVDEVAEAARLRLDPPADGTGDTEDADDTSDGG